MTKYVAISLVAILLAACNSSKNPHSSSRQEEDLSAKELLQGIWLDDETESPLMRIEGDTIYYADSQSAPITFKIIFSRGAFYFVASEACRSAVTCEEPNRKICMGIDERIHSGANRDRPTSAALFFPLFHSIV